MAGKMPHPQRTRTLEEIEAFAAALVEEAELGHITENSDLEEDYQPTSLPAINCPACHGTRFLNDRPCPCNPTPALPGPGRVDIYRQRVHFRLSLKHPDDHEEDDEIGRNVKRGRNGAVIPLDLSVQTQAIDDDACDAEAESQADRFALTMERKGGPRWPRRSTRRESSTS
jgi:hypothetical protein